MFIGYINMIMQRGHWLFDPDAFVLKFLKDPAKKNGPWLYEVDLDQCKNSAQILDWIAQVSKKRFVNNVALGDLMLFLDDLFDLQKNVCSFGKSARISPRKCFQEGSNIRRREIGLKDSRNSEPDSDIF